MAHGTADDADVVPVDASALVELVVSGRHRRGADALLSRYEHSTPRLVFVSAAHALVEAVSAVRRLVKLGVLEAEAGSEAVRWLAELELALDPPTPRLRAIWSLRDRMSAYDAAYFAMAEAAGRPLVTADRRLLEACRQAGIAAVHMDDLAC